MAKRRNEQGPLGASIVYFLLKNCWGHILSLSFYREETEVTEGNSCNVTAGRQPSEEVNWPTWAQ